MNFSRYIAPAIRFNTTDSVSYGVQRRRGAVILSLLVAASTAAPLPALAADHSASDLFVARVMVAPWLHHTAARRSVAATEYGSAAEMFVETVLKGHPEVHHSGTSGDRAMIDDRSWHGPDLRFLHGSGSRD